MKRRGKNAKLSLVIPTKDRYEILIETIPILSKQGFYEIILVDSSNALEAAKNKKLCEKLSIRYYHFVGNREEARNFGVKKAKGDWVYIFDDDIVLDKFNWKIFNEVAKGDYDFIHTKGACYVWIFRRNFFLKIGGYDPKLCYGDDYDITVRAYENGKPARSQLIKIGGSVRGTLKMRWMGTLYYSMTMLTFFRKYPTLKNALSIPYRPVFFLTKLAQKRTKENLIKFMLTTLGVLLSPFYYIKNL